MTTSEQPSGFAVGWTAFAGILMIVTGIWWAISGIVALVNGDFYVIAEKWAFELDVSTWGWIHLILGIIIAVAGFGLFSGKVWARTVGVIIAIIAALVSFAWLPAYPIWAIIFVISSFVTVWVLTVHGHDITEVQ